LHAHVSCRSGADKGLAIHSFDAGVASHIGLLIPCPQEGTAPVSAGGNGNISTSQEAFSRIDHDVPAIGSRRMPRSECDGSRISGIRITSNEQYISSFSALSRATSRDGCITPTALVRLASSHQYAAGCVHCGSCKKLRVAAILVTAACSQMQLPTSSHATFTGRHGHRAPSTDASRVSCMSHNGTGIINIRLPGLQGDTPRHSVQASSPTGDRHVAAAPGPTSCCALPVCAANVQCTTAHVRSRSGRDRNIAAVLAVAAAARIDVNVPSSSVSGIARSRAEPEAACRT
jgi:hypothetical protein